MKKEIGFLEWEQDLLEHYIIDYVIIKDYGISKLIPVKKVGFNSLCREKMLPEILYKKIDYGKSFKNSKGQKLSRFFRRSELIRMYELNMDKSTVEKYIEYIEFPLASVVEDKDIFILRYDLVYSLLFRYEEVFEAFRALVNGGR